MKRETAHRKKAQLDSGLTAQFFGGQHTRLRVAVLNRLIQTNEAVAGHIYDQLTHLRAKISISGKERGIISTHANERRNRKLFARQLRDKIFPFADRV
jgi:hypothetical protein